MSVVSDYKKVSLGDTEQMFIMFFAFQNYSAYGLWSHLKTQKKMSYKNVHAKIKRLIELDLLEEEGRFKRNAIKYKLTTRGLFERLILSGWQALHPTIWYDYKDNIILQTLLYRFFETRTIWKLREVGYSTISALVADYLRKCCEEILRNAPSKDSEFDQLIRNEVRDLILKIITMSSIEQDYSDKTGKLAPDYKAFMTLRGDKKFFGILREIQGDFDKGCKRFGL
jgi:hypothetical protein